MPTPPGALLDPATRADPAPFWAWLREHAPVYRVPDIPLYLVATWDIVIEALGRTDDFSSNLHALVYTSDHGMPALYDMSVRGASVQTLATADPPSHTAHRRAVFPSLVERKMREVEGYARAVAADLVAEWVAQGRFDAMRAVIDPFPMTVLAEVLGLGMDGVEIDDLLAWAFDGTELLAGTNSLARMDELGERAADAGQFLFGQLAEADPDPAVGVIGAVAKGIADGAFTPEEGIGTLVILLGAGGESTTSLIGSAVRTLAEQPDLQDALRSDLTLVPPFVEEMLRLESPFKGHYRVARRATELGGTSIPDGATLFLAWSSANRDAAHFDAPDELRLDRANPRDHLGFGRGIHHCVGAPLARMEARVALEELLLATERFSLDPARPPAYVDSMFVRRHAHLDLVTEPASR
jgi:cytochrome P450